MNAKITASLTEAYKLKIEPSPTNKYKIIGNNIYNNSNNKKILKVVAGNTLRSFHRKRKNTIGAGAVTNDFFENQHGKIIEKLKKIKTRITLDRFSDELANALSLKLSNYIKRRQLESYNKVRKIVDLYIEHQVILGNELSDKSRSNLLPILFVPLDFYVLNKSDDVIKCLIINPSATMGSIKNKCTYDLIQSELQTYCITHKIPAPIAFDLLWRDRYKCRGNDFLEITLEAIKR